jgi:Dolichyl-phosphate-mannose-protein mannosyltransferase
VHPPFAKLLFGLAGWFVGFDGQFNFENIGDSYTENHVPYVGMRALPAILGSLTIPVVYGIMKESGYGTVIAAFSASIVLFGTYGTCLSQPNAYFPFFSPPRQRTRRAVTSHFVGCYPYFLPLSHRVFLRPLPQAALSVRFKLSSMLQGHC